MKHGISPTTPTDWREGRPVRYIKMVELGGGKTKDPAKVLAHKSRRGPLVAAHGPGTINAEADMRRLVSNRKLKEAAAFYEVHHRIRGVTPMRTMKLWYDLFKAGSLRVMTEDEAIAADAA